MKLATFKNKENQTGICFEKEVILIDELNKEYKQNWSLNLFDLIKNGELKKLTNWYNSIGKEQLNTMKKYKIPLDGLEYGPLYKYPRKIWGIGLNYVQHASDLYEKAPRTEPASFMKPDTSIIGHLDTIEIPHQSNRTTAEAELGIVIGEECKNIPEEEAESVIAGFTTIIDMTAEDILQQNPRYLTRAKSFDTFFSFGPQLVTPDEISNLSNLTVSTIINGKIHRENTISNMTFNPWYLVSFHSRVMKLLPGDIIATGTPGAVVIRDGDIVECKIEGFNSLVNSVKDLKRTRG